VAKSIAAVVGAKKRNDGYFESEGYLVSWCYGHLVELAMPAAYGEQYRKWSRETLPILPDEWKYAASKDKKAQLGVLRGLMGRADVDTVVNACDSGREGELIFRLAYGQCGCGKPVKRLWISSMEEAAIRAGFADLKDGAGYDSLYHSALCRAQADYLVGINATRIFSILYGATLNVGRVITPTLALLVRREEAVAAFVKKPYYIPQIDCGGFTAQAERTEDKAGADKAAQEADGKTATVAKVEKQEKSEAPPRLYDLTGLQRDANRLLGFTAQQTLDYLQALYEKRLATYPRTDSKYLTEDMAESTGSLIGALAVAVPFAKGIEGFVPDLSRIIDSSKVGDHHAVIPTMEAAGADLAALPSGERGVLNLIIARLLAATAEKYVYETLTASLSCGGVDFAAKGKTVVREGWKKIDAACRAMVKEATKEDSGEDGNAALPEMAEGGTFGPVAASVREGFTSPPKHYTEDTLLSAMETAGAEDIPDEAERKGLGTPATRAGIIEKLIKTGFAERDKKRILPADKGKNLIAVLPDSLTSPLLTAEWETRLLDVERGNMEADAFMAGIGGFVKSLVEENDAPDPAFASLFAGERAGQGEAVGICPRCGAEVIERGKGFFCSSRACKFALWKDSRFWSAKGKKLDKKTSAALLTEGRVFFSDLKSGKTGKTYAATIVLADDGERVNYIMQFEEGRKTA
jgi:DNA topoisomerase-3